MALTNDDKQWIKGAITDGVVEALESIVLPRFDEHDKRFDRIEKRLDSVESRLTSVESRLTALESDMRDVKAHLERLASNFLEILKMAKKMNVSLSR